MSTELSASPWTQRAGILEFSRLTQKQGTHTLKCRKCTTIRDRHFSKAVETLLSPRWENTVVTGAQGQEEKVNWRWIRKNKYRVQKRQNII